MSERRLWKDISLSGPLSCTLIITFTYVLTTYVTLGQQQTTDTVQSPSISWVNVSVLDGCCPDDGLLVYSNTQTPDCAVNLSGLGGFPEVVVRNDSSLFVPDGKCHMSTSITGLGINYQQDAARSYTVTPPCFLESSSSSPTSSSVTSEPVVYSSSSERRDCCLWKDNIRSFHCRL